MYTLLSNWGNVLIERFNTKPTIKNRPEITLTRFFANFEKKSTFGVVKMIWQARCQVDTNMYTKDYAQVSWISHSKCLKIIQKSSLFQVQISYHIKGRFHTYRKFKRPVLFYDKLSSIMLRWKTAESSKGFHYFLLLLLLYFSLKRWNLVNIAHFWVKL